MTKLSQVVLHKSTVVDPADADNTLAVPSTGWVRRLINTWWSALWPTLGALIADDFAFSTGAGYFKFADAVGGFTVMWGTAGYGQSGTVLFPILPGRSAHGFPNRCFQVQMTSQAWSGQHNSLAEVIEGSLANTGFSWQTGLGNSNTDGNTSPYWLAIGY